ncbi:MAG TPA: GNAT family N-acetyltransferase [Herpetosiphonaceae bacterium]|nr:GNAT family N-acetyltransferase [Herpetosiphonaceae bacterium]
MLNETDAAAFRTLRLRALQDHPEAYAVSFEEEQAQPPAAAAERLRGTSEEEFIAGAFVETQLVGMAGFRRFKSPKLRHKAHVWGMYVAPEARGRPAGRALLDEVIQRARALPGLEDVALAVTVGNDPARHLYLAAGFVPYCVEPRFLKIGDRYWDRVDGAVARRKSLNRRTRREVRIEQTCAF